MVKIGNIELPDFPFLLAPMEDVSDPPFRRLCKLGRVFKFPADFADFYRFINVSLKSFILYSKFNY